MQYYSGIVNRNEMVQLVREPQNPYDENAIKVVNIRGEQVGHVERYKACHMAPLLDRGLCKMEGLVTESRQGMYRMPCQISVFCRAERTAEVLQALEYGDIIIYDTAAPPKAGPSGKSPTGGKRRREEEEAEDVLLLPGSRQTMEPSPDILSPLFPHQKEALAWMVQRENKEELPPWWVAEQQPRGGAVVYTHRLTNSSSAERPASVRGGIFADDMGLGKTLVVLALIATNRPGAQLPPVVDLEPGACLDAAPPPPAPPKSKKSRASAGSRQAADHHRPSTATWQPPPPPAESQPPDLRGPRATLVVCPLTVLGNWTAQAAEHVAAGRLSLYVHHGPERLRDPALISRFDLVLTTYNVVASELGGGGDEDGGPKRAAAAAAPGALAGVRWLRVVLDEGHVVKNGRAKQTRAAMALKAERRWAVTGTPIQNSVRDLHSLVAFLRLEPFVDRAFWVRAIERPLQHRDPRGADRLRALLSVIALRRTKEGADGRRLVELPPKRVRVQAVELGGEEREVYGRLEADGQRIIGQLLREGTVMRNYQTVLVVILRLRQICDHASLCPAHARDLGIAVAAPGDADAPIGPEERERLASLLQDSLADDCPICLSAPVAAVITRCAHVFCRPCIQRVLVADKLRCPMCRAPVRPTELVEAPPPGEPEEGEGGRGPAAGGGAGEELKAAARRPSAKISALIASLKEAQADDPGVKSVVFSQFTAMLALLHEHLTGAGFRCARLDGGMAARQREAAMDAFRSARPGGPTVFLVSLKAAGVGVNLVTASRVYLMEPWWNPALEEQAMDRVHRLGQTKPVDVIRFAAAGSIEERMLELQAGKRELAAAAFGRRTAEQLRELRLKEVRLLMRL